MSRNNKNATRNKQAKEVTARRKNGNKGPSETKAQHGKKNAWWQRGSYSQFIRGGNRKRNGGAATEE